jgi:hypothetical protein
MSEVTGILSAIEQGDPHAADQLLPPVYDELRKLAAHKLAQEKPRARLAGCDPRLFQGVSAIGANVADDAEVATDSLPCSRQGLSTSASRSCKL